MNAWVSSVSIAALSLAGCSAGVGSRRVESLAAARGASISTSLATASSVPPAPVAPINATCPVLVGTPVDPAIHTLWQGRVVAFADAASLARWESSPLTYVGNLPRGSGSAGDAFQLSTARVVASAPRVEAPASASPAVAAPAPSAPVLSAAAPSAVAVARARVPLASAPTAPKPVVATAPVTPSPMAASGFDRPSDHPFGPGVERGPDRPAADAPAPAADDGTGSEECQDCPGGHCRLPGR